MQPICLVMDLVELLAQDLAGILAEVWPEARVLVAHEPGTALKLLDEVGGIDLAFLNAPPPSRVEESPLIAPLVARGTRVILMGDEAEAQGERSDWVVLQRPFSVPEVLRALDEARARPRADDGRRTNPD